MQTMAAMQAQGLRDLLQLWRAGVISDAIAIYEAIRAKDWEKVRMHAKAILAFLGYAGDAKEIDELITEILDQDFGGILSELADELKLIGERNRKTPLPGGTGTGPVMRVMGSGDPDAVELKAAVEALDAVTTRAQAQAWFAAHKETIRKSAKRPWAKFFLRRAPEVQAALAGNMDLSTVQAIDPERLAQIIEVLRWTAKILAGFSVVWPPALLIAQILNLIIAFYDSKHPTLGTYGDVGLSLEDLL